MLGGSSSAPNLQDYARSQGKKLPPASLKHRDGMWVGLGGATLFFVRLPAKTQLKSNSCLNGTDTGLMTSFLHQLSRGERTRTPTTPPFAFPLAIRILLSYAYPFIISHIQPCRISLLHLCILSWILACRGKDQKGRPMVRKNAVVP